jgi:hypothetical protein
MSDTRRRGRLLPAALLLALLLPAGRLAAETAAGSVSLVTEDTTVEGYAELRIRAYAGSDELKAEYGGAHIAINRIEVGLAPYVNAVTSPGIYLVSVSAEGYYSLEYTISVVEKTRYFLDFHLKRQTGFLSVRIAPSDASLSIDGVSAGKTLLELPTGPHLATVRRFAYIERSLPFVILTGLITSLDVSLEKAPFEVRGLNARRPAFDPRNAGLLGRTLLGFTVTSYGSGRIEILSPEETVVASFDFPSFTEWSQKAAWTGRNEDGEALPDGLYRVRLSATPAPETSAAAPIETEITVRLDSSLALSPFGSAEAMPGLRLFPDPASIGKGIVALELFAAADQGLVSDPSLGAAIGLGASFSFGPLGLGLSAYDYEARGGGGVSASLRYSFPRPRSTAAEAALFVRASIAAGAGSPALLGGLGPTQAVNLEASLPFALRFGAFHIGLGPGLLFSLPYSGDSVSTAPLLRAGLWLAERSYRLGFSAEMAAPSLVRIGEIDWPLRAALEIRGFLGPSPLVASATASCRYSPSTGAVFGFSAGLGLVF